MRTITLAEYRQLEPTLTRPLTDRPRERALPAMFTPQPPPSAADLTQQRWDRNNQNRRKGAK